MTYFILTFYHLFVDFFHHYRSGCTLSLIRLSYYLGDWLICNYKIFLVGPWHSAPSQHTNTINIHNLQKYIGGCERDVTSSPP